MKPESNVASAPTVFGYCVYTIRHSDDLCRDAASGGRAEYTERTAWIMGRELFQQAQAAQARMPVLFGAAEQDSGLIYMGYLEAVSVTEPEPGTALTRYVVGGLRRVPFDPPPAISTLILRSSGKALSEQYIRPYAICVTPDFISTGK